MCLIPVRNGDLLASGYQCEVSRERLMSYIHDIVDLGCYPIDRPESSAYRRMMADLQQELREDGSAVLSGFVHAQGLTDMVREADAVAQYGHKSFSRKNAYFSQDDPSLDAGHPVR